MSCKPNSAPIQLHKQTYLLQNHLLIRSRKLIIISRTQMSCPRIEYLNKLCSILNLIQCIFSNTLGQILKNGMEQLGFRKCHLFNLQIFLGGFTLHEVGGKCVWTSDKSQYCRFGCHLSTQCTQCLGNKRCTLRWINQMHLLHILIRSHGRNHRSDLLINIKIHTHTRQWCQYITEQYTSIGLIIPPWL